MDIHHVWCNLKQGVGDIEFSDAATAYFEHLKSEDRLSGYRITRRKLGLGPECLPEFHIMLEFDGLAQLDRALGSAATRIGEIFGLACMAHPVANPEAFGCRKRPRVERLVG